MSEATAAPAKGPSRRGGALDALRFGAALFVVLFHFGDEAPTPLSALSGVFGQGWLATDFFLMLSGFVLARAYGDAVLERRISPLRFWLKRLARSYPTHLIMLAVLMVMVAVAGLAGVQLDNPERFDWSGVPAQVLLLHAFGAGAEHWNVPAWTLSTLLACYAGFPVLWRALQRLGGPVAAVAAAGAVLAGSDWLALTLTGQHQFNLTAEYAFFRAAPLFLVGLCVARFVGTARPGVWGARAIGLGGLGVLAANLWLGGPEVLSLGAIAAVIAGAGAGAPARSWPGAEWGARVSFSLFMIHTAVGAAWFGAVQPLVTRLTGSAEPWGWGLWLGGVACTVGAAAAYHVWIDQPLQGIINRRLFGRRADQPATASSPTSSAGAEWVRAPTEITSTPVSAIARTV